jgi:hypothetical protein
MGVQWYSMAVRHLCRSEKLEKKHNTLLSSRPLMHLCPTRNMYREERKQGPRALSLRSDKPRGRNGFPKGYPAGETSVRVVLSPS